MADSIIFHHVHQLCLDGATGSQVRPARMLNGFRQLGFSVEVIAGDGHQRAEAIRRIKQQVVKGRNFSFLYAESSTSPSLLAEPNYLPVHPFLDFGFFYWLRRRGIPVGLFYRDVYWRFPFYRKKVARWKNAITIPLYWYDWFQYARHIDTLFLPSLEMADYLPTAWPKDRMAALPPGGDTTRNLRECETLSGVVSSRKEKLRLFYVGSIDPTTAYDLSPLLESVNMSDDACLCLCCPEVQWQQYKSFYQLPDKASVQVIHRSGNDIKGYYEIADVFCIIRKPAPYLEFAMPIKLFEAIHYGLPIIANRGTLVAKFVEDEGIGWVINDTSDLQSFYSYLNANRDAVAEKRRVVEAVREKHTWRARANTVAKVLLGRGHKSLSHE